MTAIDGNILEGVSATTLWTLHNRGSEAKRSDGVIRDPWAVTLLDAISYDYRKFGKPNQSHASAGRRLRRRGERLSDGTSRRRRWWRWPRVCRPASGGWNAPALPTN